MSRASNSSLAPRPANNPHAKQKADEGNSEYHPEPDSEEVKDEVDRHKEDDKNDDSYNNGDIFCVRIFCQRVIAMAGTGLKVDVVGLIQLGSHRGTQFLFHDQYLPPPWWSDGLSECMKCALLQSRLLTERLYVGLCVSEGVCGREETLLGLQRVPVRLESQSHPAINKGIRVLQSRAFLRSFSGEEDFSQEFRNKSNPIEELPPPSSPFLSRI